MSTALSASSYIHEGVWINWRRGLVLGSTVTVNPYHASILSPALAIFISIAGSQLWRLFQFALHQIRATSSNRSLIYHQQQVILRNTATDLNTLWRLLRTGLAWRHQRDAKVLRTSLPLIFWTIVHLVLIVLLGLFSSWLLEASDEVLVRSPWCGTYNQSYTAAIYTTDSDDLDSVQKAMQYTTYQNWRYGAIQQHVDICRSSIDGCDTLPTKTLNWSANIVPGGCPFDDSICHPEIDGSISFDTGYLSSAAHLGFNAKKHDRVAFRMVAQCAPLDDAKHSTAWQDIPGTDSLLAHQVADALYGASATNARNATYTVTRQPLECDQRAVTPAYSLNSEFAHPGGNTSAGTATFDPIKELQSLDADLSLVMLSFINAYSGPVSDPWFSAKQAVDETNAFCLQDDKTLYMREQPLTTIGCTQQWQICNGESIDDGECTPLEALSQAKTSIDDLNLTPNQIATVTRIFKAATGASFYYVINALAQSTSSPLKARNLISNTIGVPLPNDQWQTETKYWIEILLKYLQQTSLDFGTGQFAPSTEYINITKQTGMDPMGDAAYWLCQNQIIHNHSHRNFNFFALLLTVVLCTIIIILGLSIEDLIGYIRQRNLRYSGANGKQDMWIANSDLDMLKTIDEIKNGGHWTRSKNGIPLGPVGHQVSIQELRNETMDVEKGAGIVNLAVKRTRTGLAEIRNMRHPYGHGHSHDHHHKKCPTCSTFELSPTRSSSQESTPGVSPGVPNRGEQPFTFHNNFSTDLQKKAMPAELNTISREALSNPNTSSNIHEKHPRRKKQYHILNQITPPPAEPPKYAHTPTPISERPYEHSISTYSDDDIRAPKMHVETPNSSNTYSYQTSTILQPNNRTQDLQQVYEPPSPYTSLRTSNGDALIRPPSGWGVLPRRMSGLWSVSG